MDCKEQAQSPIVVETGKCTPTEPDLQSLNTSMDEFSPQKLDSDILRWLSQPSSRDILLEWIKTHAPERIPALSTHWNHDIPLSELSNIEKTLCDLQLESIINGKYFGSHPTCNFCYMGVCMTYFPFL
jgi:hypothetical protein